MGKDELPDDIRQSIFSSQIKSVGDVPDDRSGTFLRGKVLVIVDPARRHALILYEAKRILHLADVVVKCSGPDQQDVRIDGAGSRVTHVHHLQRMLEGSRSLVLQLPEQPVVRVAKLPQP